MAVEAPLPAVVKMLTCTVVQRTLGDFTENAEVLTVEM